MQHARQHRTRRGSQGVFLCRLGLRASVGLGDCVELGAMSMSRMEPTMITVWTVPSRQPGCIQKAEIKNQHTHVPLDSEEIQKCILLHEALK